MADYKSEINLIIREGIKKGTNEKEIVQQILSLMTQVRKTERVPIKEYESLVRDSKDQIRQARNRLRGLSGT